MSYDAVETSSGRNPKTLTAAENDQIMIGTDSGYRYQICNYISLQKATLAHCFWDLKAHQPASAQPPVSSQTNHANRISSEWSNSTALQQDRHSEDRPGCPPLSRSHFDSSHQAGKRHSARSVFDPAFGHMWELFQSLWWCWLQVIY